MTRELALSTIAALVLATLPALSPTSQAAQCDCGQPVSSGSGPVASDCLRILNFAVGLSGCGSCSACTCDVNGDGAATASDALTCLNRSVGAPSLLLCAGDCGCECPASKGACSGAELTVVGGSELDLGWTGDGHGQALVEGAQISLNVVRRCGGSGAVCIYDSDCLSGESCDLTCNCDEPCACGDVERACELAGPTDAPRCTSHMNVTCSSSADCPAGDECRRFFGPPQPLSATGRPICTTKHFAEDLSGTLSPTTGAHELSGALRTRVYLGIDQNRPCPRCGAPSVEAPPTVGERFTCEGGARDGEPCTVEAASPQWGGVSSDCPPHRASNISGLGLLTDLAELTTGRIERQARVPCAGFFAPLHPDGANPLCLDDLSPCSSNADCTRCTGDLSACVTDEDCGENGLCRAAPEQPISCGFYCHCGYCSNDGGATVDPHAQCFGNDDCGAGAECVAGSELVPPQAQNNRCGNFICGLTAPESCCGVDDGPACILETTAPLRTCSLVPHRGCFNDLDCSRADAGTCELRPQPCFENTIVRTGRPSSPDSFCQENTGERTPCTNNADCSAGDCVGESIRATVVALSCVPHTSVPFVNGAFGLPGPAALRLETSLDLCRCGNGEVECTEECDDGNNASGDGCDEACFSE